MDLFYDRLSVKGKAWMDLVTSGCLFFYLAVMLMGSISSLQYAIATGERRFSMWNPSMIPIKVPDDGLPGSHAAADHFACHQAYATIRGTSLS